MMNEKEVLRMQEELAAMKKKESDRKDKERRYWAKQAVILAKAQKQGIGATNAEIDTYIKTHYNK